MRYDVSIQSVDQCALFDVRGDAEAVEQFLDSFGATLQNGVLNSVPNGAIVRIGSRRCMVQADLSCESSWMSILSEHAPASLFNAVNVSDMYSRTCIRGSDADAVLSQAVSLNLNRFPVGELRACEIFDLAGYLYRKLADSYVIYVDVSYEDYFRQRLAICAGA